MTADLEALLASAEAWAAADFDPTTRAEAQRLAADARAGDEAATAELRDAFSSRLGFGTAGLRGRIGAGPCRMNRVVVSQTSAGFAAYLHERAAAGLCVAPPSAVIGYDGRVNSDVFARDAAEVLAGAGIRVTLLPAPGPTPLTAFAVRHLGVSAGVMITASHNPPDYNGYKVYLGDADRGSQIIPPVDAEIATHIDRAASGAAAELPRSTEYTVAGSEIADAYVAKTAEALRAGWEGSTGADIGLAVVYTAMHGVGAELGRRVFERAGLPPVVSVEQQERPDGAFPTLEFPNPEEPGSLDLAFQRARTAHADLVVAHDPDADRLAIAPADPASPDGYRRLTGNELGLLLGWRAAGRAERAAVAGAPRGSLACTIVCSPGLRAVAAQYGLDYAETLPGFKWVSRVPGLVFGYEESLGYLTHPGAVRDKDGISAAADAVAMAQECRAAGVSIWDLLDEASMRFGHFASDQLVLRFSSMRQAEVVSAAVRRDPPREFAGVAVERAQDLLVDRVMPAPANVLRFDLVDGARVMMRPSGTEPKLKVYLDAYCGEGSVAERRSATSERLSSLKAAVTGYLGAVQGGSHG